MDTLDKKIDTLLEELIYCDFRSQIGVDKAKKKIRLALKRQDRDTRHACADAVISSDDFEEDFDGFQMMSKDDINSLVMNCRRL